MDLKVFMLGGAALVGVTVPAIAASELRGTYFAIEAGANWADSDGLLSATGLAPTTVLSNDYSTGWAMLGAVGYSFANGLRSELEAGYRHNEQDQLLTSGGLALSSAGEIDQFTLMANLLYDFRLGSRVTASIGAGVGADMASFQAVALGLNDEEWVFAYQGLVGLNYAFADGAQIFLNYRYLRADAPEYTQLIGGPPVTQRVGFADDLDSHTVTLGFRFGSGGKEPLAAPAASAPPPPPAPPPAPPAAPRQFIVFFGFNRHELTDEALRVVADAADAAKQTGAASIVIIGHTDSSGAVEYNQKLSERRAAAVKTALVRDGLPAASISTSGKGEDELVVRTADGVQEPQNRRATIDLQ